MSTIISQNGFLLEIEILTSKVASLKICYIKYKINIKPPAGKTEGLEFESPKIAYTTIVFFQITNRSKM